MHVVSRSVRDSAAVLDATAGPEAGAPYRCAPEPGSFMAALREAPRPLRIAFSTQAPTGVPVDRECRQAVEDAAALCAELGHEVEEGAPAFDVEALGEAMITIISASTRALLDGRARQLGRPYTEADLEPATWAMVRNAGEMEAARYVDAVNAIHAAGRAAASFHERYDVYVSPTLAKPPIRLGILCPDNRDIEGYMETLKGYSAFTAYQNMTGEPSMSVPLHWTDDGLPVGVMFSAGFGGEALLLQLAGQLEAARPWGHRRPSL